MGPLWDSLEGHSRSDHIPLQRFYLPSYGSQAPMRFPQGKHCLSATCRGAAAEGFAEAGSLRRRPLLAASPGEALGGAINLCADADDPVTHAVVIRSQPPRTSTV